MPHKLTNKSALEQLMSNSDSAGKQLKIINKKITEHYEQTTKQMDTLEASMRHERALREHLSKRIDTLSSEMSTLEQVNQELLKRVDAFAKKSNRVLPKEAHPKQSFFSETISSANKKATSSIPSKTYPTKKLSR